MAALTFSAVNGGYESDWFQPNGAFQLDLQFADSDIANPITNYSANDNTETNPKKYAIAAHTELKNAPHVNFPVLKVVPDAGVYYKVSSRLNPTAASYLTA